MYYTGRKLLAEITTLENERARIANDLHDELGPILSAVKLRTNNLEIRTDEDKEELEMINKNIDDMMKKMRTISNDLLPNTLRRKGLIAAITESVNNANLLKGLSIQFHHENVPELSKEKSVNLFRILQEIIHNTLKHSAAKELKIELTSKNEVLYLISEDDGSGFDYSSLIKESSGLGLRSLLSRAEIMDGEMFVESKLGKGTRYIFEIPLP